MMPQTGVSLHELLTFRKHYKNSDKNNVAVHWDTCSTKWGFQNVIRTIANLPC